MRRILLSLTTAVAVLAIGASSVFADSVHLIGTPTVTLGTNSATFAASVAGLGNGTSATFNLAGTINVSSRCYTRKNNTPQAANKQEQINVNSTQTFPVKNGRTDVSFTVSPISTLTCPNGQHVVIESFTYNLDLSYGGSTIYNFHS